jgi:DNA-binding transcriptional MerR regulator
MTTQQVAQFAQVSLRQLQWWDERGHLTPSYGVRRRRIYTRADAVVAAVIGALRIRKVKYRTIERAVQTLKRSLGEEARNFRKFMLIAVRQGKTRIVSESAAGKLAAEAASGVFLIEIEWPPADGDEL